jgi:manganese transport protein
MNLIDSVVALNCAFFVNAAILVLAGAVFHFRGHQDVAKLEQAHSLLSNLLGTRWAPILFAVALLCAGQSSTITGTLAGQIVMEGFLQIRIRPWLRRLISRGLAIVPAALVISLLGDSAVDDLLVLSQVVLSLQLSFAVIPLVAFTSDRKKMGEFVSPRWVVALAVVVAVIILGLNAKLASEKIEGWFKAAGSHEVWLWVFLMPAVGAMVVLLAYLTLAPLLSRFAPGLVRREVEVAPPAPAVPAELTALPAAPSALPAGYRRIAVALEMGPADAPVLEHVWRLVAGSQAELILLHVAESAASRYLGEYSSDKESREDRAALEAIGEAFRARGVKVQTILGYGDVKTELARLVTASGADILITGSHGHRLLLDIVRGATTSGLRHLVQIPVLTVPSREAPPDMQSLPD